MRLSKRFGPGLLVTAAFIGPGTVTTATLAGASYGYALLWVLLFSVVAAIVLQEMAARLGLVTREGLGEALRTTSDNPLVRAAIVILIVSAITFGNAAYQFGNITGAAIGLEALTGVSPAVWAIATGVAAALLLAGGTYRLIERMLIVLVVLMSGVFLVTAIMVRPDLGAMLRGAVMPRLPEGSLTTVIALIGTTVVPYNLFLHASSVREKWPATMPADRAIAESRVDTVLAVALGGLITLAIVTTAAAFFARGASLESAADMARQLEPLLGRWAKGFFAIGLMAAGLTSAITAPLAAAYATSGAMGWPVDMKTWRFRAVWLVIIVVGTVFAATGTKPVSAIRFAQAANGLILPVVAVFLLITVNRRRLLGERVNGGWTNVLGTAVVVIAAGLGGYKLWKLAAAL